MVEPVSRVLYPALVLAIAERTRVFEAYRLATVLLLSLEVPAAFALFVNAELVLHILGGRKNDWVGLGAAVFLRVLCFAPLADPLGRFGGDVLVAHHRDRSWIAAQTTTLVWFVGAGLFATWLLGPIGMAYVDLLPLGSVILALGIRSFSRVGL